MIKKESSTVPPTRSVPATGQLVEWKTDKEVPLLYANVGTMSVTPFDVSLTLGEVDQANTDRVFANPRIKLHFAPEYAAVLAQLLQAGVKAYVDTNGALRASAVANRMKVDEQESRELL